MASCKFKLQNSVFSVTLGKPWYYHSSNPVRGPGPSQQTSWDCIVWGVYGVTFNVNEVCSAEYLCNLEICAAYLVGRSSQWKAFNCYSFVRPTDALVSWCTILQFYMNMSVYSYIDDSLIHETGLMALIGSEKIKLNLSNCVVTISNTARGWNSCMWQMGPISAATPCPPSNRASKNALVMSSSAYIFKNGYQSIFWSKSMLW